LYRVSRKRGFIDIYLLGNNCNIFPSVDVRKRVSGFRSTVYEKYSAYDVPSTCYKDTKEANAVQRYIKMQIAFVRSVGFSRLGRSKQSSDVSLFTVHKYSYRSLERVLRVRKVCCIWDRLSNIIGR